MRKKTYPLVYAGKKQPFAKSVVAGNLVFLSGANGQTVETGEVSSDNVKEQMIVALDKMRVAMEEAGSSMNNVVKTIMCLRHVKDYSIMRKTELEYYQKHAPLLVEDPPASTFAQVNMQKPGNLIEIDAIGAVSRNMPGWEVTLNPSYYGGVKRAYPYVTPGQPTFSKSAVVGNLAFFSGLGPPALDSFEVKTSVFEEQMAVTLDKIKLALEEAGSAMGNIIKATPFLMNMENIPRMQKSELEYYKKHAPRLIEEPPACTLLQPHALARAAYMIETEIIGVLSRDKPSWEVKTYPMVYAGKKQPFSKLVVVGDLVFLSGSTGRNLETGEVSSNNVSRQTIVALDKIRAALEETGSSMENIVKTVICLKHESDYEVMRQTELEYYKKYAPRLLEEPPASTFLGVASLARPDILVEIEVVAVIPR